METIKDQCMICGETIEVPDKGLGRASYYTWRTRHQHPEVP